LKGARERVAGVSKGAIRIEDRGQAWKIQKFQASRRGPKTLYDGISPEVTENNEAPVQCRGFHHQSVVAFWHPEILRSWSAVSRTFCLQISVSSLLHFSRNEGASGDVDENKGAGKTTASRDGIGCWCPKLEVRCLFQNPLTPNPSPPRGRGES
jgi:hypothetical protein